MHLWRLLLLLLLWHLLLLHGLLLYGLLLHGLLLHGSFQIRKTRRESDGVTGQCCPRVNACAARWISFLSVKRMVEQAKISVSKSQLEDFELAAPEYIAIDSS